MKDTEEFNKILSNAFRRMHSYTCAEASLQAVLELWDLPRGKLSWATAGYMGAISSGMTTCGLLIGSSIAIGYRCGQGKEVIPEQSANERSRAIKSVNMLYKEFLAEFKETECKKLLSLDLGNSKELSKYIQEKAWKRTCDIFLNFIMNRCKEMEEKGIV